MGLRTHLAAHFSFAGDHMPVVGHIPDARIRISDDIEPRPNVRGPISVFKFTGFLILNNSPAASSSFIQPRISDIAYSPL